MESPNRYEGSIVDRGRTFDSAAASYDAHRNGYPTSLFADLVTLSRVRRGDRVLEVGCGSGQATIGLVAEGLDVTGVDPGASLVELARSKFAGLSSARFELSTFEEWQPEGRKFHLVAAAQSWHWVRSDIGFIKAADALMRGGSLAVFGHTPAWSAKLIDRIDPIYAQLAPELPAQPPEAGYLPEGPIPDLIGSSGRFGRPEHRGYAWRRDYTAGSFAAYLGTRSDCLLLPEERRAELLSEIEAALPDTVEADWTTNLYVAPLT
jgi:SAM-dependent methyltransferase